jgi:Uma2 family endonuclease
MATQSVAQERFSVEEYLSMKFEHDCEYIDGAIRERALGDFEHCFLQGLLCSIFFNHRSDWGILCLPEQHIRITPSRYLIPDVTLVKAGLPREPRLTKPPLLAIEIQSPDDTLHDVTVKSRDYLGFGIVNIWVIDPKTRKAYYAKHAGLEEVTEGLLTVPGTAIRVSVEELFAEMDRA